MNYKFVIQVSNPRTLPTADDDDRSLSDAIQSVFPLETEYAIVVWNWTYIPLTYKYDVSLIVQDVIDFVEAILASVKGRRTVEWPSNTFSGQWTIEWDRETVTVVAKWSRVLGGTESLLACNPIVKMPTLEFIGEWKALLETVLRALVAAGYVPERIVGMQRLNEVVNHIQSRGLLYRGL